MQPQYRLLWFRRLALLGALLAAGVIVLGAWVRLTDAGLGCPDWPGCYGHVYPDRSHDFAKALHEMIHRYFATSLGLVIVGLLAWAIANRKDRGQPLLPVAALFVVVCLQGALGAFTVTLLLKPLIVTAHLLGGLTLFGLLWWLSLVPERRDLAPRETGLRIYALLGLAALIVQVALGGWTSSNYAALACPDFPTCQSRWWPPMDFRDAFVLWRGLGVDYEGGVLANPARVAIQFTHRLGAVVAGSILMLLAILALLRARGTRLRVAAVLLLTAVLLQAGIGMAMVRRGVPLPLATLHNAGAVILVFAMVTLLRALWPAPSIDMVPLDRAIRT
ncbi:MAG: COX15/CtaA family protein [Steroidobacteraceae bacterium]|jgi:cytochrome c oxidase assembly protein subunit 15